MTKKQKTPLDLMYEKYYKVRINYFQSLTPEEMRRKGIRVSGIERYDEGIPHRTVESEYTIAMMFSKWKTGLTISVINYADTAEIYQIIHDHLVACAHFLSNGLAVNGSDTEMVKDLIELDKFASVVYDKAKSIFTEQERAAVYNHHLGGVQSINFFNIMKRSYSTPEKVIKGPMGEEIIRISEEKSNPKPGVRERESLQNVFIDNLTRAGIKLS